MIDFIVKKVYNTCMAYLNTNLAIFVFSTDPIELEQAYEQISIDFFNQILDELNGVQDE